MNLAFKLLKVNKARIVNSALKLLSEKRALETKESFDSKKAIDAAILWLASNFESGEFMHAVDVIDAFDIKHEDLGESDVPGQSHDEDIDRKFVEFAFRILSDVANNRIKSSRSQRRAV
jgi:hypothetical protein